ncbi:valerianol synthase TPS8-like [Rhododendron vialii]|uniref:valerianol synthase TPS8-like n=1 Tax=Rhododendron vialii TaxID=182163 RepID=UPI00265E7907|nr:valerianol synthase TPS8-like [Rhododendron vialii]
MFPKFEEYSHVFHDNLFMVSLHFRVFRQHGYDLSSDDTYDAYGTYEELKCFTNAVQRRWDMNAIDQLPNYMKPIYKALLNVHDEFYQEIMAKKEINYSVQYLEEAYKEVVRCYDVETEWLKKGYVQKMEEYLANALVTITSPLLTTAAFVGMGEIATLEAFQWLQSQPRILMACSTIFRVINDIQSCKRRQFHLTTEDERSHVATGVECYMKQHGVSRPEAISDLLKIIENAWIDINEEMMRPTMISRDLVIRILNFACLYGVVYKYSDGYTQPECAKDSIIALYEDSISI